MRLSAALVVATLAVGGCDEDERPEAPSEDQRLRADLAAPMSVVAAFAPLLVVDEDARAEALLAAEAARVTVADATRQARGARGAKAGPHRAMDEAIAGVADACEEAEGPMRPERFEPCRNAVVALGRAARALGRKGGFPGRLQDWVRPGDAARARAVERLRDEPFDARARLWRDPHATREALDEACSDTGLPSTPKRGDAAVAALYAALGRRSRRLCNAWRAYGKVDEVVARCLATEAEGCPDEATCERLAAQDPDALPVVARERRDRALELCDAR